MSGIEAPATEVSENIPSYNPGDLLAKPHQKAWWKGERVAYAPSILLGLIHDRACYYPDAVVYQVSFWDYFVTTALRTRADSDPTDP